MNETFAPRLNHVAISVDATVLNEVGRAELMNFYSSVFGWQEGDNTGETGNPLIVYTGSLRQFLYLLPSSDDFLTAPPLDHFGLEVSSLETLESLLGRARRFRESDDRVRIIETSTMTTHGPAGDYTLTNAYLGFLIPLMIELQHIAAPPDGRSADR
jgi:hypothetical protein